MDRRAATDQIAANVRAAVTRVGAPTQSISEATGIPVDDLTSRLSGEEELTVDQLVNVGGFLRVPASLLTAVSA